MAEDLAEMFAFFAGICSALGLGMMVAVQYGDNMGAGAGFLSAPFLGLAWYATLLFIIRILKWESR